MALLAQLYEARFLLLVGLLTTYFATKLRTFLRLRHFKGPFSTGWSEAWHIRAILSLKSHIKYMEVTDRYGSIARVGPNDLITTSPELLMHMNAVRSLYTRGAWYYSASRFEPGRDHIFSQLDEGKHTKRRHQMAAGYSGKENPGLESSIDGRVHELIHLIRDKYISTPQSTKPMDLAQKLQYLTLDVISLIGFGQAFGMVATDSDVDSYVASSKVGLQFITYVVALGLQPIVHCRPFARLFGPKATDERGVGRMIELASRLIDARLSKSLEGKSDMLASFIGHGLNRDDLVTESILQILAGSDTTATSLRVIMLYVISHPNVYRRLQKEVDRTVEKGLTTTGKEVVSEAVCKGMEYMQAVIKEALRISPPVTDVVPKVVPKGGDRVIVDGEQVYLPEGTHVGYCVLGLMHREDVFGDNVEFFRPERWLINDRAKVEKMSRTIEMVFGYGKYQCLGKGIAYMEIGKVVFEFMRNFDWAIAKPEEPWKAANFSGIFHHEDMWVLIEEREHHN